MIRICPSARSSAPIGRTTILAIALLIVGTLPSAADDESCVHGTVQSHFCEDSRTWCGFDTYTITTPKTKYKVQTTTEFATNYSSSGTSSCDKAMDRNMCCPGKLSFSVSASWNNTNCVTATCNVGYIGTTLGLFSQQMCGGSGGFSTGDSSVVNPGQPFVSLCGVNLSATFNFTPIPLPGSYVEAYNIDTCVKTGTNVSGGLVGLVGLLQTAIVASPTQKYFTNGPTITPSSNNLRLTEEYKRQDVEQAILDSLAGCPTGPFELNADCGESSISGNTITVKKVGYQITFDSAEDTTYEVRWNELISNGDGTPAEPIAHVEPVLGTGSSASTTEHFLLPPLGKDGTSTACVDTDSIRITPTGTIQPIGSPVACCGNAPDGPPGAAGPALASVEVNFRVGKGLYDRFGGLLLLRQDSITPASFTPAPLSFIGDTRYFDVIINAQGLRQVKGGQCLVDVITNDVYSYDLRFYALTNVGSKTVLYSVVNSPFVVWNIQNPDGATATNRLRLI